MNSQKIPTDLQVLDTIYEMYNEEFVLHDQDKSIRETKIYVPIDCHKIADKLKVNGDIIFGRLHYHLEEKYGYDLPNPFNEPMPPRVKFFALKAGNDRHCVNFPLLVSVLAGLRQERKNFWTSTAIALSALVISLVSLGGDIWIWKLIQLVR